MPHRHPRRSGSRSLTEPSWSAIPPGRPTVESCTSSPNATAFAAFGDVAWTRSPNIRLASRLRFATFIPRDSRSATWDVAAIYQAGLSAADGALIFSIGELKANVWLEENAK